MNEMDDFDSITLCLIEDQPVFEAFNRPSAKAAEGWTLKGAQGAELRPLCQCLKGRSGCVQKALRSLYAAMLFEIFGV